MRILKFLLTITITIALAAGPTMLSSAASTGKAGVRSNSIIDITNGTKAIDQLARRSFGVGLAALALLINSGPGVFNRQDSMSSADRAGLRELEIAKLAVAHRTTTVEGKFVELTPTRTGLSTLTALGQAVVSTAPTGSTSTPFVDPPQTEKLAEQLDYKSKTTLGVTIRSLCLLFNVHGFYEESWRKDSLMRKGMWDRLQELENHGYVTTRKADGYPDDHHARAEWVQITATDKGRAVILSLKKE